jgi:hypothetical protein
VFQWVEEVKNVKAVVKKPLRVVKSPDESIKQWFTWDYTLFNYTLPIGFSIPNLFNAISKTTWKVTNS